MPIALPPLYAIVDEEAAGRARRAPPDVARALLRGGVRFMQLRAKLAPGGALLAWCDEIAGDCRAAGAIFIVNDRADAAAACGADGVHVGQDDLDVEEVRGLVGAGAVVGVSTHTPEQVDRALTTSASYVAVGPVFATVSKDTGYVPVGLDLVRYAVGRAGGTPIVAIGGITAGNAPEVLAAGAASVAVIGDLVAGGDPEDRARRWRAALAGSARDGEV